MKNHEEPMKNFIIKAMLAFVMAFYGFIEPVNAKNCETYKETVAFSNGRFVWLPEEGIYQNVTITQTIYEKCYEEPSEYKTVATFLGTAIIVYAVTAFANDWMENYDRSMNFQPVFNAENKQLGISFNFEF